MKLPFLSFIPLQFRNILLILVCTQFGLLGLYSDIITPNGPLLINPQNGGNLLRISSTGVGINTDATQALDVAGNGIFSGNLTVIGTLTYSGELEFDAAAVFNESGNTVDFRVEGDTDANLLFIDGSADYVGIGDNTPAYKLDVSGDGRYTGDLNLDGALKFSSSASGITQNSTSLGMKIAVWSTTIGIGMQSGVMEFFSNNAADDFRWGIGTSGSLTEKMYLDSGTGHLKLSGGSTDMIFSSPATNSMLIRSGTSSVTGVGNSGFGSGALNSLTDGTYNTAVGYNTMLNSTTADYTVALGYRAMGLGVTTGNYNTAIGRDALYDVTSGSYNLALGYQSMYNATTGSRNVAIGGDAMGLGATTGNYNVAVGWASLYDVTSGTQNVAIGYRAMNNVTTGGFNIALGYDAMQGVTAATTGSHNTGIGREACHNLTTGVGNNAIGWQALRYATTADYSVAMGYFALQATTTGDYNLALGYNAGKLITTGHNNIIIGKNTNPQAAGNSDELNIGNTIYGDLANDHIGIGIFPKVPLQIAPNISSGAIDNYSEYQIMLFDGGSAANSYGLGIESNTLWLNTYKTLQFKIGGNSRYTMTATGLYPADDNSRSCGLSGNRWNVVYAVNGTIQTSDRRAKKNIKPLDYGLGEIMSLKPVYYDWKENSNKMGPQIGLIAQDVLPIVSEAVYVDENEEAHMGLQYDKLVPVLINGMQEQQGLIKNLDKQIDHQNKVDKEHELRFKKQEKLMEQLKLENQTLKQRLKPLEELLLK